MAQHNLKSSWSKLTTKEYRAVAPRAKRARPEQDFQIGLVRDLTLLLPPDCIMTAFPAGGGGKARGGALKAMGLLPGFPDLMFFYRGRSFGMELKVKAKVSSDQLGLHQRLIAAGVDVRVVRTLKEACNALDAWEIPPRYKVAA